MSNISDRIGQKNTIRVISAVSGSAGGVAILAENVIGGIASVTQLNVSGISSVTQLNVSGISSFVGIASFKDDVYIDTSLYIGDYFVFDDDTAYLNGDLIVTGITSLNDANISNLFAEQLRVSEVFTLNDIESSNIRTNQLDVSGIATFNFINGKNLLSENLKVTGISTLNIVNVSDLTVLGISTLNIANVSDLFAEQLRVSGVSTFSDSIIQIGDSFVGLGTTNPEQKLDIVGSIKISENIYDSTNFSGQNAYFLSRDGEGIRWVPFSPTFSEGIYLQDEGLFISKVGIAQSFTILNFSNINSFGVGNDNIIPTASDDNIPTGLSTIFTKDFWGFTPGDDIYRMTNVGIKTNDPKSSLDLYGDLHVTEEVSLDSSLNVSGITTIDNDLNVSGITTIDNDLNVSGITTIDNDLIVSNTVDALTFFGDGVNLSGIVTQITSGIGISISSTQANGKGRVKVTSYTPTGKTIFVNQNGNDNNTGLSENHAKRTIKSASNMAVFGDTIKVYPGVYVEENPIILKKTVSVEGTELRNCVVTPKYPYLDLFQVNNGCHITDMSFIGPDMTDGASVVTLQPLEGVSVDRYFDAARMIRLNLDYIANETVGFLTSGFSGFAGNHREQDAARLIDKNIDFIAAEAVGFLTSVNGLNFTVPGPGTTEDCADDIRDIFRAISYDLKANSNRKSVGAALSYFNNSGALVHITGTGVSEATISTLEYAVGIAKSVINNLGPSTSYQSGIGSISQVIDPSVIFVSGGCVGVGTTITHLVGIITSAIGAGNTLGLPSIRYGVTLESQDCADDIKDIWKCVIHDITRGGNSRCVDAGIAYYDDEWNLIPQILKNPGEVGQTVRSIDYSFNIARSIVNNCTWGGYPVGLGTDVINSVYDYKTGITTITANNHSLSKDDAVLIRDLEYECESGSPGEPIEISNAIYDSNTGITTIITKRSHHLTSGMVVKLEDLVFECDSGGGLSTAIYPSGNYGYNFTVQDILTPFSYIVNVGVSTLEHLYVDGGTSTRLYTPVFGVSTAVYDNITGISTITTSGFGTSSNVGMYIEPGKKVKLEDLVFECDSGGGLSTAIYPSGNLGYSFEVISTNEDRYVDASNLIEDNKIEIIDKSLASIAIAHSDFYFPIGVQTTRYSRFKDSYRLIQQNRQEIIDRGVAEIAIQHPDFYYPNDPQTTSSSRYKDAYRLIQLNKTEIITNAYNEITIIHPEFINPDPTKCQRDIGYFVDAISLDLTLGGNTYSRKFTLQYFDNGSPISNGLLGEEAESITAFNKARDLMKLAITNQLTVKDLTITADPITNSNINVSSCADVQSNIDNLVSIVTTIINDGDLDNLPVENVGNISSGEAKCKRDLGYFVDAVSIDIFTGGNNYSIEFVKQYFDNGSPISNGLLGEESESITAFNKARDLMKLAITNQLYIKDLTLTPDPITGSNISLNSCSDVQSAIDTLTEIVTTVINFGNLNYINSIAKNPGIFVLGENKCRRDIGFVVDSLIKDLRYGTSKHIRESTRAYFNANGIPISNGIVGEEAPSITAFNAIGYYAKRAMRNLLNVKDLTITADPTTNDNQSETSCADVATNIDNLISILTTSVANGNLNSFPPLYVSNKIKVNVGISTIPHYYISGGNVISNYTTNIFPDGTYNYIFPVHKVIDNNKFEFIGGKTNLPHSYVSGGKIQKYKNFQNQFTQVKDLGIQIDPETGFNNSINSCANVISAIHSCVGVVTTIVGLGSESNIKKTYPGNSGSGIENYYDIFNAIYDETTGKTIINSPGIMVEVGDLVEVRDLIFECSSNGQLSTQKFPSGTFGYEFFVERVNLDGSFEISVGISTLPHTYVSGGIVIDRKFKVSEAYYDNSTGITTITVPGLSVESNDLIKIKNLEFSCPSGSGTTTIYPTGNNGFNFRVLDIVVDKPFGITSAVYDNISGIVTVIAPEFSINKGNLVELRDLEFTCPDSPPNLLYPSGSNGYKFQVEYVNEDGSFAINVGGSTIPHTYVSGGTIINRTLTSNDKFTIQVGASTIPHTYVSGGIVTPPFSKGVGPITQGPYVRNCTNFIPKSIGMSINGFSAEPGDQDDIGVTGTMSVDSYTQYNQGGIGVSITNGAYAQLVSIFTICDDIAIFTGSGGQCDITNSNSSFGRFGLVSNGVGDAKTKSIYRYTGTVATTSNAEQANVVVSGIGNYRPYDGQALYFGELFYSILRVEIIDGGNGYTTPPTVIFDDPPVGVNGIRAEGIATIENGSVVSVDLISTGTQYRTPPKITFIGGDGSGVEAISIMAPIYYTIQSATLPSSGISTITLNTNLNSSVSSGTTVYFSRLSLQITSSHSFEWVGSGNDINKAKPALGGVVIQENEVVKIDGGEIVYTSTDQAGNFRIGDGLVVNQLTGTVSGRAFNQSLINTLTPLIIALGN